MKRLNVSQINAETIEKIKDLAASRTFDVSSDLFYEGQIPCVAYLLLEGQINLIKRKKVLKSIQPGTLIGVNELMNHVPSALGARIQPNSSVCFLDKSTLLEIMEDPQYEDLYQLFGASLSA